MSLLKADTIKPVTSGGDLSLQGDSGGSAVDCLNITSAGDINFTGNTDAKIKLPSAGGIYESDGSTAILTESGGAVTLQNVDIKALINASGSAPIYACRAWVNFNGTGTVAIRGSGNVASITDHGAGMYTVTFSTAMPSANYSAVEMTKQDQAGDGSIVFPNAGGTGTVTGVTDGADAMTAASCRIMCINRDHRGLYNRDMEVVCLSFFA